MNTLIISGMRAMAVKKIVFILKGPKELGRLNREFEQGKAQINPIDLKKSILHLKDLMYEQIRRYRQEKLAVGSWQ